MSEDESCELLLSITGRIGDRAKELAKLCGYLPIALRNAAGAIDERKDLSVAEYEHRLSDKRKLLELIEASFSLSYELLSDTRRHQWCRLSVFPGDFDRKGATAVLKMQPELSSEVMNDLVKWSLMDFIYPESSEYGRYKLHDLARVFAELHLTPDELIDAQQRHASHYLKVLSDAAEIYMEGGENVLAGLDIFDREWTNIKYGQAWTEGEVNSAEKPKKKSILKSALQMDSSYGDNGIDLLRLRLYAKDRIKWIEIALTASRKLKRRGGEKAHLTNLGTAYSDLGDARKAIDYCNQALAIDRETGYRQGEGIILCNLGGAYSELGDARKAIDYFNQAIEISREIGDRNLEGEVFCELGNANIDFGNAIKSIECCELSLKIVRETGHRKTEGNALCNLGRAYAVLGETTKAIECYDQSLKIVREIEYKMVEGEALFNMSLALDKLGQRRKAMENAKSALSIFGQIESSKAKKVQQKLEEWNNMG